MLILFFSIINIIKVSNLKSQGLLLGGVLLMTLPLSILVRSCLLITRITLFGCSLNAFVVVFIFAIACVFVIVFLMLLRSCLKAASPLQSIGENINL